MNHRLLIRVAAFPVMIGLLLSIACLVGAWHVNRLQTNLANILDEHVASMQAAQQLELTVRQLRTHCFVYLVDPNPGLLAEIRKDQQLFKGFLEAADRTAHTPEERKLVSEIQAGYNQYDLEFEGLLKEAEQKGALRDLRKLRDAHPARHILDPCEQYYRVNEEMMAQTAQESRLLSQRLHWTMLFLGVGGPLGGLLSGYGIARGLSQSLYRLSVHVQDMAQHLEQDVGNIQLTPNGDLQHLDKQLAHVVARVEAVGERLRVQEREMLRAQQLAAVGQLAASVAHEVRNPLTSIKLLVDAGLRNQQPRPFTAENLQVIHREILRLEQTVQSFLDFARPPVLQRVKIDVREVVAQALELVRARARQQRVQIDAHCPEAPVGAEVDRSQLCSVFVNLFLNALDAMPGGGRMETRLSAGAAEITFTVTDTGTGIEPGIRQRLFTPFTSTKATGSGLGLSICKRIVEGHGGRIQAENLANGGARFSITFPVEAGEV